MRNGCDLILIFDVETMSRAEKKLKRESWRPGVKRMRWRRQASIQLPRVCETRALPSELHPLVFRHDCDRFGIFEELSHMYCSVFRPCANNQKQKRCQRDLIPFRGSGSRQGKRATLTPIMILLLLILSKVFLGSPPPSRLAGSVASTAKLRITYKFLEMLTRLDCRSGRAFLCLASLVQLWDFFRFHFSGKTIHGARASSLTHKVVS